MKRFPALLFVVFSAGSLSKGQTPPGWWHNPIREDPAHYFFSATADSNQGTDEATERARENALGEIARRMGVTGADAERAEAVKSRIRNWSVHALEEDQAGERTRVWLILRYPKDEYRSLEELVFGGEKRFGKARELAASSTYGESLDLLAKLIDDYPLGSQPFLPTEDVLMFAATTAAEAGDARLALAYYQRILNLGSTHPLFQRARQGYLSVQERNTPSTEWAVRHQGKTAEAVAVFSEEDGENVRRGGVMHRFLQDMGFEPRDGGGPAGTDAKNLSAWVKGAEADVAIAFTIQLGRPVERDIFGNTFYVFPVSSDVTVKVTENGTGRILRDFVTFEVSDRHGRKDMVELRVLRGCMAAAAKLIREDSH